MTIGTARNTKRHLFLPLVVWAGSWLVLLSGQNVIEVYHSVIGDPTVDTLSAHPSERVLFSFVIASDRPGRTLSCSFVSVLTASLILTHFSSVLFAIFSRVRLSCFFVSVGHLVKWQYIPDAKIFDGYVCAGRVDVALFTLPLPQLSSWRDARNQEESTQLGNVDERPPRGSKRNQSILLCNYGRLYFSGVLGCCNDRSCLTNFHSSRQDLHHAEQLKDIFFNGRFGHLGIPCQMRERRVFVFSAWAHTARMSCSLMSFS